MTLSAGKMLFTLLEYFSNVLMNVVLNANERNAYVGLARPDINYKFFTFNTAQFKCDFSLFSFNFEFLVLLFATNS